MPRTSLRPDRFETRDLWKEAIALGQELPVVPDSSIMYIGMVGMMSSPKGSLLTTAVVRWTDRAGNCADFNEGGIEAPKSELLPIFKNIMHAMGKVETARIHHGFLKDDDPWKSSQPQEQETLARDFAQRARLIRIIPEGDMRFTIQARDDDRPDRDTISRLANINLHMARLVGDEDTSFYQGMVTRAQTWAMKDHIPENLGWLV